MEHELEKIVESGDNLIGGLIHNIDKAILSTHNTQLKNIDLTFNQALIILHIYQHSDHDVYQKDLENWLGLTNPSVTSLIKTMMGKDLIYRIQSKHDGRYFSLHLTPKSLSLIDQIVDTIIQSDKQLYKCLNEEETVLLKSLLSKVYTHIKK